MESVGETITARNLIKSYETILKAHKVTCNLIVIECTSISFKIYRFDITYITVS